MEPKQIKNYHFTIPEIIRMKRDGLKLTQEHIEFIVESVTNGTMEDSQLGAFLMSVFLNGMTNNETAVLTQSMKNSGTVFSWPKWWNVVDKHSTGGVGDKASIPLAPALAALGLKVPMISGRGLEHTGGTLDKLESIPGYTVSLNKEQMKECLEKVGCCIVGQTKKLVPADGRMYSLRDVTSTVSSIPLIVSSIISKKASEGLNALVLDVKFGSGSLIGSLENAETLAESLVAAGNALGIRCTALITSMDCPIGRSVGNSLEIIESLECLRGRGPPDLRLLVSSLGGELLKNCGKTSTVEEGVKLIQKTLDDGSALKKFSQMLKFQGVCEDIAEKLCNSDFSDLSCLSKAKYKTKVQADGTGTIVGITAIDVAKLCLSLGGGRLKSTDSINYSVGAVLLKTVGEIVTKDEPWLEIHHDEPLNPGQLRMAQESIAIQPGKKRWSNLELISKRVDLNN